MNSVSRIIRPLCISMACAFLWGPVVASANMNGFYNEGEAGWFWYQDPVPVEAPEPEEKKPEEKEPSVVVMAEPKDAPPPPPEDKGPKPLSVAWFRANLQEHLDRAIDQPTKQNVEAYYLLQRVMMDKAETFSEVAGRVVMGDKLLDETNRMSMDGGSFQQANETAFDNSIESLNKISKSAGIFFFFSDDCDLCSETARILSGIERKYETKIQPVTLDGSTSKAKRLSKAPIQDQGQSKLLDIDPTAPAVYLAVPPNEWIPLSFGVVSQSTLIDRILMAANESKILSDDEFDKTRSVRPSKSLADSLDGLDHVPEDTSELIRLLRQMPGELK